MHEIQIARFAIDILLMLGIIYMATRLLRASIGANGARIAELEGGLRRILSEAELSTRDIDSLLSRRRQDLEKLLIDVEAAEGRVSREVRRAEEQRHMIELDLRRAATQATPVAPMRPARSGLTPPAPGMRARPKLEREIEKVVEEEELVADEDPITWSNVNIYGEPIEGNPQSTTATTEPKAASNDLERVVASAKKVMESSSAVMGQPMSRNLQAPTSEVIRSARPAAPAEQKLGVLGMKRQVQVL